MKRLFWSAALIASLGVMGCQSQHKNKPAAPHTEAAVTPQPYQPPANQPAPEAEPVPPPPPPATVTPERDTSAPRTYHRMYVVRKGDTLTKIAHRHHTTVRKIIAANPGIDPNHIRVGQKISMP